LDQPAYSIGDAAHFLKLPYATARSWVVGYNYRITEGPRRFYPVIEIPNDKSGFLSFRNVVELHVLSAIRRQHKVRLKEVRTAVAYLKEKFTSRHPLADQQMSTNGTDLFVEKYGQLINASQSGQLAMREVLAEYLDRIERSADGVPLRLYPFSGRPESKAVVIDPEIRFGKPCVSGSGIPTVLIADRFYAGETISDLAKDYGRKAIEIEEAIRFEQAAA